MSDLTMKPYGKDAIRLMRGPHLVAMLLRLSNERWSVCDHNEKPLTKASFLQAYMARDKAAELLATPTEDLR